MFQYIYLSLIACMLTHAYSSELKGSPIAWGKSIEPRPSNLNIPTGVEYMYDVRPLYVQRDGSWILFGYDGNSCEGVHSRTDHLFDAQGNSIAYLHKSMFGKSESFYGRPEDRQIFDCWKQYYEQRDVISYPPIDNRHRRQ